LILEVEITEEIVAEIFCNQPEILQEIALYDKNPRALLMNKIVLSFDTITGKHLSHPTVGIQGWGGGNLLCKCSTVPEELLLPALQMVEQYSPDDRFFGRKNPNMCQESLSSSKPAITNMAKMLAAHSVQFHHGGSRGGVGPRKKPN